MKVLVACESSGVVRDAFRARGHDAWSCDLLGTKATGPHLKGDAAKIVKRGWDLIIAHPPCTYLTVAAAWCFFHPDDKHLPTHKRRPHPKFPGRLQQEADARDFFMEMMNAPADKVCVENPVGRMSTYFRKPDQIIQPYQFGADASKKTCLWLRGLSALIINPLDRVPGRIVDGKERWANQTDSGQNRLGPSDDRWDKRSATYPGIARAMAEQWG